MTGLSPGGDPLLIAFPLSYKRRWRFKMEAIGKDISLIRVPPSQASNRSGHVTTVTLVAAPTAGG